jgi:predicted nuclease of predicted toxin-antitoxin system
LKFLLDENLSPRLIPRLSPLFGDMTHVRDVGLERETDTRIWSWARENAFTIVTTDSDFRLLSEKRGAPPRVILLERCDFPLRVIESILRANALRISEFEGSSQSLLSLKPDNALDRTLAAPRYPEAPPE